MRISGLSLIPVSVALAAVLFALSACGGGGGAGGTGGGDLNQALYGVLAGLGPINSLVSNINNYFVGRGRSRQYGNCPSVRFISSTAIEFDFGSGCYSYEFDGYYRGRIRVSVINPVFEDGDLVDFDELRFDLYNLSTWTWGETYTGFVRLTNIDREDAIGLSLSLQTTYSPRCTEKLEFSGSVTYSEGWFSEYYVIQGTGQYTAPASGRVNLVFNNLVYNDLCDNPVGGSVTLQAGVATATLSFVADQCGMAFLTIGNSAPVTIDLDRLADLHNPCLVL